MKLQLISAGAAQGLVATVAATRGVEIAGSFGAVGAMLERFRGGEACDVLILTDAQVTDLASRGEVAAETVADLGSVATSVAVREADTVPDVSSGEALRAALLAADAIYFPDPAKATAGIHFAKVIEQLGIREEVQARLRAFPNGATAMRNLADAKGHPIGCTQATEILATPRVRLAAALPKGFDLATVYTASVNAGASSGAEARAFVEALSGRGASPARAAAGFAGFAVRGAKASDAAAVRAIVGEVLAEYGLAPDPGGIDRDLADLDAHYFSRGGAFLIAVAADGIVVGSCGVVPLQGSTWELRKMYLRAGARGRGLGKRLLARSLAFVRSRGGSRVELETASVLREAIGLYTAAGFRQLARSPDAKRCDKVFALDL